MSGLSDLTHELDYSFKDAGLLKLALTHPSLNARNNQRLEFLGDAVLQLIISRRLYVKHPSLHEGMLTQLRQKLVCEQALAKVARRIGLGAHLLMDKGFEQSGGRDMDGPLSDAVEAVLAAVYMDGGMDAAQRVADCLFVDQPEEESDPKSALQELLQARGDAAPSYETVLEEGPAHDRRFTVAVLADGAEISRGTERSKKRAEQEAARKALKTLQEPGGGHPCG